MSTDSISKSEMLMTIKSLTTHKKGIDALCKFLKSGSRMRNTDLDQENLGLVIQVILESCTRIEQYEDVKDLFKDIDTSVSYYIEVLLGALLMVL